MHERVSSVVLLFFLLLGMRLTALGAERRSCAVLPFESGKLLSEEETQSLMYRYDAALRRTDALQVMTRGEVSRRLAAAGHDRKRYSSAAAAAIAAGTALGVEYVIFGNVEQQGNRWYLETSLVDVSRHRYINRVRSYLEDSREPFLLLAPGSNAKDLFTDVKLPRTSVRAPQALERQPEPAPEVAPVPKPAPPGTAPERTPDTTPKPTPKPHRPTVTPAPTIDRPERPEPLDLDLDLGAGSDIDDVLSYVSGNLEVGTRFIARTLLSENKDNFLGSIDHLEMDEDMFPTDIFVAWFFTEDLGIEFEWDTIEADTITTKDGHNDGRVRLSGPVVSMIARFPITTATEEFFNRLTPYAGVGVAFLGGNFEPEGWWHHGFSHPDWHAAEQRYADWVAAGQPPWPNGGYQRNLSVKGTTGFVVTGGCTALLDWWDGLYADFYIRYMNVRSDATVVLSRYATIVDDERTAELPFHNLTFGLGLRYAF